MKYVLEYPTIDTHNNRSIALYIFYCKNMYFKKSETTFSFLDLVKELKNFENFFLQHISFV